MRLLLPLCLLKWSESKEEYDSITLVKHLLTSERLSHDNNFDISHKSDSVRVTNIISMVLYLHDV